MATELLAGALTGAGCAGEAGSSGAGIFLLAVDVARLGPAACRQVERLCGFVRGAGAPAGGVWVPGELAARRRARQARDGVALAPAACRLLARWSARLGQRVPPCSAAPAEGLGPGAAAVGGSR